MFPPSSVMSPHQSEHGSYVIYMFLVNEHAPSSLVKIPPTIFINMHVAQRHDFKNKTKQKNLCLSHFGKADGKACLTIFSFSCLSNKASPCYIADVSVIDFAEHQVNRLKFGYNRSTL